MSMRASGSSSASANPAVLQSHTVTHRDAVEPMQARVGDAGRGQHDVEDVRDADVIAGTDDLDRGLRQRRVRAGSDRELR